MTHRPSKTSPYTSRLLDELLGGDAWGDPSPGDPGNRAGSPERHEAPEPSSHRGQEAATSPWQGHKGQDDHKVDDLDRDREGGAGNAPDPSLNPQPQVPGGASSVQQGELDEALAAAGRSDLPKNELRDLLVIAARKLTVWAKMFFPERFRMPFSRLHERVAEVLDDRSLRKVLILAHRGFGKTSFVSYAFTSRCILLRETRFVPYISKTATYSETQTDALRQALTTNKRITTLFGKIGARYVKRDVVDQFSRKAWVARFPTGGDPTFVLPRGALQQVRGLLYRDYRPDLVLIDDLEDELHLNSPEQRRRIREWFFGAVMETVSQEPGASWRIIFTDTVKHSDSVVEHIRELPDWTVVEAPICDDKYRAVSFVPQEIVDEKLADARRRGQLDVFAREHMCKPIAAEAAAFKATDFQYFDESDPEFRKRLPFMRHVVIVDPAKTANMSSAETGFAVWSIDVQTNRMYVRRAFGQRLYPNEIYDVAFDLCDEFGALVLAVETTGLGEFIRQPFMSAARQRGRAVHFLDLRARRGAEELAGVEGGKAARVSSLIPYYRTHRVFHARTGCEELEVQLLQFPRSRRWDVMDAAAYIVQVMEEMAMYFSPSSLDEDRYTEPGEYDEIESDFAPDTRYVTV